MTHQIPTRGASGATYRRVLDLHAAGLSHAQIVKLGGVSVSTVTRTLATARANNDPRAARRGVSAEGSQKIIEGNHVRNIKRSRKGRMSWRLASNYLNAGDEQW